MDELDIETAHIVGISMGGFIAQLLAANFEQTVSSTSDHGLADEQVEANRAALRGLSGQAGTSTGPDRSCNMEHSG